MAYSKIRQPKLSDVIEQQLEFLILEGTLRPGEKLPPERELAKQFDVSRPSLREAIQRLEAKGLLLRRQGGGTFVQSSLWQSFSDPLVELLSDHPESQYDLLETRHALEGIAAYYAAHGKPVVVDFLLVKLYLAPRHPAVQEHIQLAAVHGKFQCRSREVLAAA